jgi:hypothetical protein
MKKLFCATWLLVSLFCFLNSLRAEELVKQYDEFSFPDTLSLEERENKIDALFRTLRSTQWNRYPHEFNTPEEKQAYRTQGYRTLIQECQKFNASVPVEDIKTWNIYRIGGSYQRLYNDAPESERPALLEELKHQIAQYADKERFKDIVTDIHRSIDVFPFHLEILKPDGQTLKDRPKEEQKQLIHQFYEFLKTSDFSQKGMAMELVDNILREVIGYLEKLAANEPAEKEYASTTLKNYGAILGEKYDRGKSTRKVAERLEMAGKICLWKLPLFGSDEFVDFFFFF